MTDTCQAYLELGDDEGDNSVTFHCQWPAGHDGLHCEQHDRGGHPVIVLWERDSRLDAIEEAHVWLSDAMPNPPSIETIATWSDGDRARAVDWAMWQDYPDVAKTYPCPEFLETANETR